MRRGCHRFPGPAGDRRARTAVSLAVLALLAFGCASSGKNRFRYEFFAAPRPAADPWYEKVDDWQTRELSQRPQLPDSAALRADPPRSNRLRIKMGLWEAEERLAMARRIAEWAQSESRRHYRVDPPTSWADDPWPTTRDLLQRNGDDCDGLDLIAYQLMREFGFPPEKLYRAIVRRNRDRANHMVTLWFENGSDPWVIDSTGAVTRTVRRFSDLPGWTPTKVFNERDQFTPRKLRALDTLASHP